MAYGLPGVVHEIRPAARTDTTRAGLIGWDVHGAHPTRPRASFEIWTTSRNDQGRALAEKLGAHRTFDSNEKLPRKVQAVVDNIGPASWAHSMASVARGGTIVITGVTTGLEVSLPLLPMLSEQITVCGSIMGTIAEHEGHDELHRHLP